MKKGFTIVELLMVLGIIAVLMGVVTTAASESIRGGRERKGDAICKIVQAGFAAYYAQYDEWPGSIGKTISSGSIGTRANYEGPRYKTDPEKIVLTKAENDDCLRDMVQKTRDGNPVLDVSGLYVSKDEGRYGQKCYGLDFMQAATIKGMGEAKSGLNLATGGRRLTVSSMHFGYPDTNTGHFRHFKIVYSIPTDSFSVNKMDTDEKKARFYDQ